MIKVYVKKQSNYPVSTKKIKDRVKEVLTKKGIVSDCVVEVDIVGSEKMLKLAKEYLGEDNTLHNVLSFPESETKGEFVYPPGDVIRLGEIILCYPVIVEESKHENCLIDDKALELTEHGLYHLLGVHHD